LPDLLHQPRRGTIVGAKRRKTRRTLQKKLCGGKQEACVVSERLSRRDLGPGCYLYLNFSRTAPPSLARANIKQAIGILGPKMCSQYSDGNGKDAARSAGLLAEQVSPVSQVLAVLALPPGRSRATRGGRSEKKEALRRCSSLADAPGIPPWFQAPPRKLQGAAPNGAVATPSKVPFKSPPQRGLFDPLLRQTNLSTRLPRHPIGGPAAGGGSMSHCLEGDEPV
jgi:hypothetical protein